MTMRSRLARLFRPTTRFEVFLLIYALALGAAERGKHYLETIPGWPGVLLALACTAVVFVAGGMLLDAVRPVPAVERAALPLRLPRRRRSGAIRSRRTSSRRRSGEASRG